MSQKEVEVEKFNDQIENIDNPDDQAETQQNQSLNDGTIQNQSKIDGNTASPQFDLRDEIQNANSNKQEQIQTPKSQSNIATPTRTASNHETSPIGQREELPQFNQVDEQDSSQQQAIKLEDKQELDVSQDKQNKENDQTECQPTNQEEMGENNEAEQSMHQSEKSAQSITIAKLDFLQSEIQQKDELIVTLQEEIKWLKQSQSENNEKIVEIEKKHEQKIDEMTKRILQLEKLLKEKENDIEQYRNGNQSLHLQDLSVISVHKQENIKSNINDKKDVTIFEVLNEKQTTADLSELGNNFWLISAERKITKNNPLYKDYFPKEPQPEEAKNKKVINYPTKKYDKSYWFKYVDIKKVPRYHPNMQLPKLPETDQMQTNMQKVTIQQRNEIQQQIIQSIQQQGSFGFSSVQQEKKKINQVQQSVPFSQKLLANNQRGGSQQQNNKYNNNKMYSSQPSILKALQPQYDADDFVADQEIEQMFAQQSPNKKPQLDWDTQPANNFLIVQHTNSSQVIEQKEKFPILSQKLSYVNQYSHKKEQLQLIVVIFLALEQMTHKIKIALNYRNIDDNITKYIIYKIILMQDSSRRTKIICSVNENCSNYNLMKEMLNAGCNAFSVNMAYIKNKDSLIQLNKYRCQLEEEQNMKIPINIILRGQIIRVGLLQDLETTINEGTIVYLTSDQHNIGNNQFIPIDSNEFLEKLSINDKLAIDYGHIILQLVEIQLFDNLYEKIGIDKICLLSGVKIYVCKCLKTGTVKSYKPISLFVENKVPIEDFQLDEVQEITLTEQDLSDIDFAAECGFDSITLSRVTSPVEITTVKERLDQKYPYIQVYARITEKLREDQLIDILNESDGCFIARSYIAMTQPVEDVVKYQTDIIEYLVFIQTYILESMSVQLKPSFADMGDISNIVKQYIDGILLSGETSFGRHPILLVQTLNQMCQKIEKRKLTELLEHPEQRDQCQINFKGQPISSAIAQSCVEMAYTLQAKAIIMLTRTISTTLKLSKLRASCQVISISDNQRICRCLNYINNVQSVQVIGFDNQEQIVQEWLTSAINSKLLNPKDCIIIITGAQTSNKDWHINQVKVTCV